MAIVNSEIQIGQNIEELLETVLLVAEVEELKAIQVLVLSVPLLKLAWIKVKVRLQTLLVQGLVCSRPTVVGTISGPCYDQ